MIRSRIFNELKKLVKAVPVPGEEIVSTRTTLEKVMAKEIEQQVVNILVVILVVVEGPTHHGLANTTFQTERRVHIIEQDVTKQLTFDQTQGNKPEKRWKPMENDTLRFTMLQKVDSSKRRYLYESP